MPNIRRPPQLTGSLPVVQETIREAGIDVAYVGGLPTDLLLAAERISVSERVVEVPDKASSPLYRGNGTVRDLDFFCFTDDIEVMSCLDRALNADLEASDYLAIKPKVSVSGYEKAVKYDSYFQLVSQSSKRNDTVHLSVGPIEEVMDIAEAEELWTLVYGDVALPILHPVAHVGNYRVRSIAGLRPKDTDKVIALEEKLRGAIPSDEWERFGAFTKLEDRLNKELRIREALQLRDPQIVSLSFAKIALRYFESNELLTKYAQSESSLMHKLAVLAVRHSRASYQNSSGNFVQ